METQLQKRGVNDFVRIDAVDGKQTSPEGYVIRNKFKRSLVAGEIGCYLSHIKALETFLKSKDEFAVVLEDDINIAPEFREAIEKSMNRYEESDSRDQWDILKLWNRNRRNIPVHHLDEKYLIGSCFTSIPQGALGMIWTRKGAEKFLRKTYSAGKVPVLQRPVDCDLQHPWEYGLVIYNLLPSVVNIHTLDSVIDETRGEKHSSFGGVLKYELNRLIPKYMYYIRQHGLGRFLNYYIFKRNNLIT